MFQTLELCSLSGYRFVLEFCVKLEHLAFRVRELMYTKIAPQLLLKKYIQNPLLYYCHGDDKEIEIWIFHSHAPGMDTMILAQLRISNSHQMATNSLFYNAVGHIMFLDSMVFKLWKKSRLIQSFSMLLILLSFRVMLKIMKWKCDKMVMKHEKWTSTLMLELHHFEGLWAFSYFVYNIFGLVHYF